MTCLVICILFITTSITIPISALNTTIKTNQTTIKLLPPRESKNLSIVVYRFDVEELDPVNRATVYMYRDPYTLPIVAVTNETGHLTYEPIFYVGEDIKIIAYHEWFGGNSTIISIEEEDPDPLELEIFLDPSKSVGKNINYQPKIIQIYQNFKNIFIIIKTIIQMKNYFYF